MLISQREQTIAPDYDRSLRLFGLQVSRASLSNRDINLTLETMMNAFVLNYIPDGLIAAVTALVEDSAGVNTGCISVPLATGNTDTPVSLQGLVNPAITAYFASNFSVSPDNIYWLFNPMTGVKTYNFPSLAVNTARQASVSQDAFVTASVDITATLSLTTGQTGKVTLQYADDSGFTTNVKTVQPSSNGNTGSLTIGLGLGQVVSATVSGMIPTSKYYRILTTNVTGAPTYGTPVIEEVLGV